MTEQEWIDQLKSGDEVFISGRHGMVPSVDKVSRTTKTQIFVRINERYESSYWKKNGRLVGADSWNSRSLIMPTDANRERITIYDLTIKARELLKSAAMPKDKDGLLRFIAMMEEWQVKP